MVVVSGCLMVSWFICLCVILVELLLVMVWVEVGIFC